MNYYSYSRLVMGYDLLYQSPEELRAKPFYRVHGHFSHTRTCPYCSTNVYIFRSDDTYSGIEFLKACPVCNWWRYMSRTWHTTTDFEQVAIMSKRSVAEDNTPLEEIRKFLIRNWGDRRQISAHKCEEVVAFVFKEFLDCEVRYLTNSVFAKDKGIDFVLVNDARGVAYAFQVKRRQTEKRECVKCVREFIGCLAESPYNKGYFVTTADSFTKDAWIEYDDSYDTLRQRGLEVSLVDGTSLFKMLKSARMETAGDRSLRHLLSSRQCSGGIDHWHWVQGAPVGEPTELTPDDVFVALGIQQGTGGDK